jgi:omega-6 fatty acid desaturase (delta-12 desaturase)
MKADEGLGGRMPPPMAATPAAGGQQGRAAGRKVVAPYEHSERWRANWQLADTLVPYAILWVALYFSLRVSYWLTLALAAVAAGFMVWLFILFHDCGHRSFYASRKANAVLGYFLGVLVFEPCDLWWDEHNIHHASAGNLDKRGVGDIPTLTAREYLGASPWARFKYRLERNPLTLLLFGAPFVFIVINRFPSKRADMKERRSVHLTNLGIAGVAAILCCFMGWKAYLMIQLPIIVFGSAAGMWLFYVQHQFKGVYWRRTNEWRYDEVALLGSSYFHLPAVFRWITGNIGFHHVHHLSAGIPNYMLQRCHEENPLFHQVTRLTMIGSLHCIPLRVWDEQNRELISFPEMKRRLATGLITI